MAHKSALHLPLRYAVLVSLFATAAAGAQYTAYASFDELLEGRNAQYLPVIRVSDPGTRERPAYTGFFFYQCPQFDASGRYLLGMRIHVENRPVEPTDRGDIGYIDLKNKCKWTGIGTTTAWNWQQGARLQWRPKSREILWNDRSDDGKTFICRAYDFRTRKTRILPRPIYDLSPDGATALTHDFERMKHGGTEYVGIPSQYEDQYAPKDTGVWKMNLDTGETELILSLERMARIAYPEGPPESGCLYFFREGWNPSGTRFIAFVKDPGKPRPSLGYSVSPDGKDVRFLYNNPSHHAWLDDNQIMDWPSGGVAGTKGYHLFRDDGSGEPKELLWKAGTNGHGSYLPAPHGDWIISDTYVVSGYQHLFLYHRPTRMFVPVAKLKSTSIGGVHRVDLHPRISPDGKLISIDSTHEGLGRQMYIVDIGRILANPPQPGR